MISAADFTLHYEARTEAKILLNTAQKAT